MNILPANLRFDPHGNAHCDTHGDIYFNPGKAQAKARELFHAAVDFDRRLAQSSNGNITVGELGFGLGMNFLTTWDIASQAGVHLHYVAIEGFPLGADQLKQAHDSAGLDSERAQALRAAWPGPVAGVHRVNLPGATLTLHQGDVVDAMASIDMRTQADVWFLDGFDPARNPAMWSPEVLAAVYEHTAPGGAAGTFSAAGAVRKALAHAGFEVQKIPGGSLKRHITQATKPVSPLSRAKPFCGHAAILGAGWAGLHTASALARRGWKVTVCERDQPGAGASGNLIAIVSPIPERAESPRHDWYRSALTLATQQIDFCSVGARRVTTQFKPEEWMRRAANNFGALDNRVVWQDNPPGLWCVQAGIRRFAQFTQHVLSHPNVTLVITDQPIAADITVLATAGAIVNHPACATWPLDEVRGQISMVKATDQSQGLSHAINGPGYITPAIDGFHVVGATHDRDDNDPSVREADHLRNRENAQRSDATWTNAMDWTHVTGRTRWRCNARDRMPAVGAVPGTPNLYAITGLTSHGALSAPLASELLADLIGNTPLPCSTRAARSVDPIRFLKN